MASATRLNLSDANLADYPELASLARGLLDGLEAETFEPAPPWNAPSIALVLEDLLADDGGEMVLEAGGRVALTSHSEILTSGSAEPHVTAGGEDVSGHSFVSFASGVTLYFPTDLQLVIDCAPA